MIIDIDSVFSFHQIGLRTNQEDSRFPDEEMPFKESACFVVCDGVGGCDKGEVASSTVCKNVGEMMGSHKNSDSFTDEDFREVLCRAYEALDNASNSSNRGMGTTLTFLIFHNDGVMAAHIGDSRIYQIRPKEGILYRSEDHSLVASLLRSGNITPDQVKTHPKRNIITRCMSANDGTRERDDATVINLQDVAPGDYFLLCTDGVTSMVDDEQLIELYSSDKTDEEKYNIMAAWCKDSDDNNTLIQIHVGMVTVDAEKSDDDTSPDIDEEDTATEKLSRKTSGVHDLSVNTKSPPNLKKWFSRLFR